MLTNTSSSNLPPKPLKIKIAEDEDKCLTSQASMEEYYHGKPSVGIPFIWESQPGTPKIKIRENPIPPLTPPPSYFYSSTQKTSIKKNYSKPNLFNNLFPKRSSIRKISLPISPRPSSSSSSSSSSRSSFSSHSSPSSSRTVLVSRSRKSFDSKTMMYEGEQECDSPNSTLCFGIGRGMNVRSQGCYASMIKVLLN
ncbi:hypothetical protein JCGZ_17333 [Jatropha curcas]|uniref:Uncharacterized protein n=2 Tax=Jatropha curcas TaxID=180498 RepID=A0A067LBA5_JATCU|nr:hypothetical protein JCGZ_17333 [Jatropha curcas]